jgi:hypothetical protein
MFRPWSYRLIPLVIGRALLDLGSLHQGGAHWCQSQFLEIVDVASRDIAAPSGNVRKLNGRDADKTVPALLQRSKVRLKLLTTQPTRGGIPS